MKKKILCICFILTGLFMSSCSSNDEVYSCNQDANEWTKEHKSEIQTMDRAEWMKIQGVDYQMAAYACFTPKQKMVFWEEKLTEATKLDWSEGEKRHINVLIEFLNENPDFFNRDISENDEIFAYKWMEYAEVEFNWSLETIVSIVTSGYNIADKRGALEVKTYQSNTLKSGSEVDCKCSTESLGVCEIFGSNSKCLTEKPCKVVVQNCGWLLRYNCDGICGWNGMSV